MLGVTKRQIKRILGGLPLTAEIYWQMERPDEAPTKSFSLHRLEKVLPTWLDQTQTARKRQLSPNPESQQVFIFATLRQWIQQGTLLGMALSGMGHTVTLAFLPYSDWRHSIDLFDLRRQNLYAKSVLQKSEPLLNIVSFLGNDRSSSLSEELPQKLGQEIYDISIRDVQYTLQIEEFDAKRENTKASRLFQLRLERNRQAAFAALTWFKNNRPDVALIPNGSILELGAVYQAARYLEIPTITYEFGEQRQRIWIAQNAEVMQQDTDSLWALRKDLTLEEQQWKSIKTLYSSRQQASLWENFSRRWQGLPSQGETSVRKELHLDERPVALLAANVIGDSLTLGRQIFSNSMTEWLEGTIRYFAKRQDVQLVVRIHPGEKYTKGPSVRDIINETLASLPEQIHLVPADANINTYDLVEIAHFGMVYTTTVGMEMAMSGVPVIVAGKTHYRNKGFTQDPNTWQDYYATLDQMLTSQQKCRLAKADVDKAWNYAYRFFFEYPCNFPWHLHYFALDELREWPLDRVLSDEGNEVFGQTFQYLVGKSRDWANRSSMNNNPSLIELGQHAKTKRSA